MNFKKTGIAPNKFADLLETDISVYANGSKLTSYAINGYTMIPIEELISFGTCSWVESERAVKLWIDGVHVRSSMQEVLYDPMCFLPKYVEFYPNTDIPTFDSYTKAKFTEISSGMYLYKTSNYNQFTSYGDMLKQLGWENVDWTFKHQSKITSSGRIIEVPHSQHYYYEKDSQRISISYYSDSGNVYVTIR
jgi:hypothetical protein